MVEEIEVKIEPEDIASAQRSSTEAIEALEKVAKAEYVTYAGPEITIKPPPEVTPPEEVAPVALAEQIEVADAGALSSFPGPFGHLPDAIIDFCHRRFSTDRLAWFRFAFPREFAEPPTVLAQIEHRPGWKGWGGFPRPRFAIGRRWYFDLSINLDWAYRVAYDALQWPVHEWLFKVLPWGSKWMRGPISHAVGWAAGTVAKIQAWIWNIVQAPHVGRGIRETFVNTYETEGGANAVAQGASRQAEWAWNMSPDLLYWFSNRPGMKLSTAEVRNITTTSCEILGYKDSTLDIFVIGKAKNPLDAVVPRILRQLFAERQFAEIARLFAGRRSTTPA